MIYFALKRIRISNRQITIFLGDLDSQQLIFGLGFVINETRQQGVAGTSRELIHYINQRCGIDYFSVIT